MSLRNDAAWEEGSKDQSHSIQRDVDVAFPDIRLSRLQQRNSTAYNNQQLPSRVLEHPREYFEPSIECILGGHQVSCFPDTGARANFLSKAYVNRHKLHINTDSAGVFMNGVGKKIKTLGTVVLSLRFKGEKKKYDLEFQVISKALRNIVLGGPFLGFSDTFSRFKHRVSRTLKHIIPAVCSIGSPMQRVRGIMNGETVEALPDTGSDILVMSANYANRRSFVLDESPKYQIQIAFADGTMGRTRGVVKDVEWRFQSSAAEVHYINFYVLDDLQCDVILGFDFLDETDAFRTQQDSFVESISKHSSDDTAFFLLTIISDVFGSLKSRLNRRPGRRLETSQDTTDILHTARSRLLEVKDDNMERIRQLLPEERAQATADFRRWWKPEWDALHDTSVSSGR